MEKRKLLFPFRKMNVATALSSTQRSNWGLKLLNPDAVATHTKGAGTTVAIIDTGAAINHPDLRSNVVGQYDPYYGDPNASDNLGHGTHCAGIVGAVDNDIGVIGIAPETNLLIAKGMDNDGFGDWEKVAESIRWSVQQGADVINLSLGDLSPPPSVVHESIKYAVAKGSVVVAASGNNPSSTAANPNRMPVAYPARYDEVIAVAAIDQDGSVAPFSAIDSAIDALAPGVKIYSTWKDNNYAMLSGTSQAAPMISGCCALLKSHYGSEIKNYKDMMFRLKGLMSGNSQVGHIADTYGAGVPDFMNAKIQSMGEPIEIDETEIAMILEKFDEAIY